MPIVSGDRVETAPGLDVEPLPGSPLGSVSPSGRGIYLGLDPGASGGLAWVSVPAERTAGTRYDAIRMPKTEADIWQWVHSTVGGPGQIPRFAVVELVQGYIGRTETRGTTMFKFGRSFGTLLMALTAARIPFETIPPLTWQRALGVTPRRKHYEVTPGVKGRGKLIWDESESEFKNRLKSKAQRLFPEIVITLHTADALLLAEYAWRSRMGNL